MKFSKGQRQKSRHKSLSRRMNEYMASDSSWKIKIDTCNILIKSNCMSTGIGSDSVQQYIIKRFAHSAANELKQEFVKVNVLKSKIMNQEDRAAQVELENLRDQIHAVTKDQNSCIGATGTHGTRSHRSDWMSWHRHSSCKY